MEGGKRGKMRMNRSNGLTEGFFLQPFHTAGIFNSRSGILKFECDKKYFQELFFGRGCFLSYCLYKGKINAPLNIFSVLSIES